MITWQIDHERHLVTATGTDVVDVADIEHYMAEVAVAGGMSYGKLLDSRFTQLRLTPTDMRSLSGLVQHYAAQGKLGPLAIVVDVEMAEYVAKLFQQRTADRSRPLKICRSVEEARRWLEDHLG